MSESLRLTLASLTGVAMGAVFFGGLGLTVRHGASAEQPALWFTVSLLLRTSFALIGFYLVAGDRWKPLLFCLLGFALAQIVATKLVRLTTERHAPAALKVSRAP